MVHIEKPPASGLLVLNDKPIAYLDRSGPTQVFIAEEQLARGNNTVQIALVSAGDVDEELKELAGVVTFSEAVESLTARAEMAFAKWEAAGGVGVFGEGCQGDGADVVEVQLCD